MPSPSGNGAKGSDPRAVGFMRCATEPKELR